MLRFFFSSRPAFHSLLRLGSVAGLLLCASLSAQVPYTFTKVVDTQTAVPSGTGNFTSLIDAFSGEGMVGFYGNFGSSQRGAYLYDGGVLARMADYTTQSPGSSSNFSDFQTGRGGILNGTAYFHGSYTDGSGTWSGIHAYDSSTGILGRLTGRGLAYPTLGGNVVQVGYVLSRGGNLLVSTQRQSGLNYYGGLLSYDGSTLAAAVDGTTTGGVPNSTGPYATNGAQIVVKNSSTLSSLDAAGVQATRDLSTVQVPTQAFNFTSNLGTVPALTDSEVFFTATISSFRGLYRMNADLSGPVSLVADTNTLFPNLAENFTFFGAISANDDSVAFVANSSSGRGIFLYHAGQISTVIDNLSSFDGRSISSFSMSEAGLSDDGLAFRVVFTDATQAIYYTSLAAIPEPSAWAALLGAGALGMALIRRRERR